MIATVPVVPVEELTSGDQHFFCKPYGCKMVSRACIERQAKAEVGITAAALSHCNGCPLGAEVKVRVGAGVVIDKATLLRRLPKPIRKKLERENGLAPTPPRPPAPSRPPPIAAFDEAVETQAVKVAAEINSRADLPHSARVVAPDTVELEPVRVGAAPSSTPPPAAPAAEASQNEGNDMAAKKKRQRREAGAEIAGVTILGDGKPLPSGALTWNIEHPKCGHRETVLRATLRQNKKAGKKRECHECASGEHEAAETPAARAPRATGPRSAPPPRRRAAGSSQPALAHEHTFPLRRDFSARLDLPADLSKGDVARLSRWLETLVFEDA